MTLDITDCMQRACESIVDPIVENVKKLIAGSNPEYHDEFRKNMVLAGGGSAIKGLGALIERRLSDMGDVNVHVVDDPVRLGAMGGLRLAMEVPEDMWKNLTLASRGGPGPPLVVGCVGAIGKKRPCTLGSVASTCHN